MLAKNLLCGSVLGLLGLGHGWRAKTKTNWDCCKPGCAWTSNLKTALASGSIKVCDKNDNLLNNGMAANSACASNNAGQAYLCSDYQPRPISDDLTYAFAVMSDVRDCCECFELTWLDGPVAGKKVQVQMLNNGGDRGDVSIIVPGGGVGPNTKGCDSQYGYDWGRQYGGVVSANDCDSLPDRLQGGCYWRWNWARGDINGWNVEVRNLTSCPSHLTDISGCGAGDVGPSG